MTEEYSRKDESLSSDMVSEKVDQRLRNIRTQILLTGGSPAGPCNVAGTLIALLRSDEPIEQHTRTLLADALERGISGNRTEVRSADGFLLPRLEVGSMGRDGRVGKAILERRRWLDAAEAVAERRAAGEKGRGIVEAVGNDFSLGYEVMEKAIKLRNKLLKELDDPASQIVAETLNFWRDTEFDRSDEDQYYFARSLFIEREAETSVK